MSLKVYQYPTCSTCKKALKFLIDQKIAHTPIPIVEKPPTKDELEKMLSYVKRDGGTIKKLFNTSGLLYKEMKMSEKIKALSEREAIDLLSKNGKLIKRPFVIGRDFGIVGFDADQWREIIL